MLKSLAKRFAEPSSWAGLAGILGMAGVNAPAGVIQAASLIGAGAAGLLAFFLPEGK
jgi:hypothetical protein